MRKKLALVVASAVASSAVVAGYVLSGSAAAATTVTVIEHATSDTVVDISKPGDSKGDLLTFHNKVYDSTDTTVAGRDQGSCIRISPKQGTWECQWTTFLADGNITVESPFSDTEATTGVITGGTGAYVGAGGSLDLSCSATECTFVFNIA
ncbi:MAG TPA: allene oxide cyclase family protein [Actinomycetota bacterium]|nr:allene oxide cyclase family protein [Actinomycetota bacterium]